MLSHGAKLGIPLFAMLSAGFLFAAAGDDSCVDNSGYYAGYCVGDQGGRRIPAPQVRYRWQQSACKSATLTMHEIGSSSSEQIAITAQFGEIDLIDQPDFTFQVYLSWEKSAGKILQPIMTMFGQYRGPKNRFTRFHLDKMLAYFEEDAAGKPVLYFKAGYVRDFLPGIGGDIVGEQGITCILSRETSGEVK